MTIKKDKSSELLQNEDYSGIINTFKDSTNPEEVLLLGIAHYKREDYKSAESIFSALYKNNPTIEIAGFLIICKLKLNDLNNATAFYKELCKNENKNIISDLESNQIEQVKNRCLFLLSIPIETSHDPNRSLHEALNHFDYKTIINELEKK